MKYLLLLCLIPAIAAAVIYDADDRYESFEAFDHLEFTLSNSEKITALDSTVVEKAINAAAAMIKATKLIYQQDGAISLDAKSLSAFRFYSTKKYLCQQERFLEQVSAATCSGALIGPRHILTAGHCVENMSDCERYHWVFNYRYHEDFGPILLGQDDVYQCHHILGRKVDAGRNIDWALIELDRDVFGREPLEVRKRTYQTYLDNGVEKKSKLERRSPLFTVGFSFGTPMKITTNGIVTNSGLVNSFQASIDHSFGNSGGPIINAKTGIIEGIVGRLGAGVWGLVNGGSDESGKNCLVSKKVKSSSFSGNSGVFLECNRTNNGELLKILRQEGI